MSDDDRLDLAALVTILSRRLIEAERPILSEHGLTMWGYVVLARLARRAVPNQLALAQEIRHDKTRLIPLLEGLERRGLLTREPDPADRRSRLVRITVAGLELHAAARAGIRGMEAEFLVGLEPPEQAALVESLARLVGEL